MMAKTSLAKKLRIGPGQRILIMNAPPGYMDELGDLPEDVRVMNEPEGTFNCVHLFVKNAAELESLGPAAIDAVEYDGLLWVSYPKRSSEVETDITRDGRAVTCPQSRTEGVEREMGAHAAVFA
jgi:hypothetical protein